MWTFSVAPALAGVVLVEPGKVAVVALVQRHVLDHRDARLAHLLEHERHGALGALEVRGEADVEREALRLELAPGGLRLGDADLGQVDVLPAGEQVLEVPLALAVTREHQETVHCSSSWSAIESG